VLNNDCRLAMHFFRRRRDVRAKRTICRFFECLGPPILSELPELLVKDIGGHDRIHQDLAEPVKFRLGAVDALAQVVESGIHQRVPRQINRVLLGGALVLVGGCQVRGFFLQDEVGDACWKRNQNVRQPLVLATKV
jgi:hypothetical protein